MKLMQIMTEKGLLSRDKSSRVHIFSPAVKEEETQTKIIDKMLDLAFGGSASKLVLQTLGSNKTSREELDKIKKMIRKGEIEMIHSSDDGEMHVLATKGNPQNCMHVWSSNYGKEFLVVDHDNLISFGSYQYRKIFFEDSD